MADAVVGKEDFLNKFVHETKVVHVEAWDVDVEIRKMSVKEKNTIDAVVYGDVDLVEGAVAKYKMSEQGTQNAKVVSIILVSPKMKQEELEALSSDAQDGIAELVKIYGEWTSPKKLSTKTKSTSKEK